VIEGVVGSGGSIRSCSIGIGGVCTLLWLLLLLLCVFVRGHVDDSRLGEPVRARVGVLGVEGRRRGGGGGGCGGSGGVLLLVCGWLCVSVCVLLSVVVELGGGEGVGEVEGGGGGGGGGGGRGGVCGLSRGYLLRLRLLVDLLELGLCIIVVQPPLQRQRVLELRVNEGGSEVA
jgi:hypothetical protein